MRVGETVEWTGRPSPLLTMMLFAPEPVLAVLSLFSGIVSIIFGLGFWILIGVGIWFFAPVELIANILDHLNLPPMGAWRDAPVEVTREALGRIPFLAWLVIIFIFGQPIFRAAWRFISPFRALLRAWRTRYVVTNERVLILESGIGGRAVSLTARDVENADRVNYGAAYGSIRFRRITPDEGFGAKAPSKSFVDGLWAIRDAKGADNAIFSLRLTSDPRAQSDAVWPFDEDQPAGGQQ